jgi:hypothetical protein
MRPAAQSHGAARVFRFRRNGQADEWRITAAAVRGFISCIGSVGSWPGRSISRSPTFVERTTLRPMVWPVRLPTTHNDASGLANQ